MRDEEDASACVLHTFSTINRNRMRHPSNQQYFATQSIFGEFLQILFLIHSRQIGIFAAIEKAESHIIHG